MKRFTASGRVLNSIENGRFRQDLRQNLWRGGVRPVIKIQRHAVAPMFPKKLTDFRVLSGPVASEVRHMPGRKRPLNRRITDRHAFVHEARDTPGGCQIDKDRPPLGPQSSEAGRSKRLTVALLVWRCRHRPDSRQHHHHQDDGEARPGQTESAA